MHGMFSPALLLQRKPLVGHPGACATRNYTYLVRVPCTSRPLFSNYRWYNLKKKSSGYIVECDMYICPANIWGKIILDHIAALNLDCRNDSKLLSACCNAANKRTWLLVEERVHRSKHNWSSHLSYFSYIISSLIFPALLKTCISIDAISRNI